MKTLQLTFWATSYLRCFLYYAVADTNKIILTIFCWIGKRTVICNNKRCFYAANINIFTIYVCDVLQSFCRTSHILRSRQALSLSRDTCIQHSTHIHTHNLVHNSGQRQTGGRLVVAAIQLELSTVSFVIKGLRAHTKIWYFLTTVVDIFHFYKAERLYAISAHPRFFNAEGLHAFFTYFDFFFNGK